MKSRNSDEIPIPDLSLIGPATPQATSIMSYQPERPSPSNASISANEIWLALVVGNSRLHWAKMQGDEVRETWDEPYGDDQGVNDGRENDECKVGRRSAPSEAPTQRRMPLIFASVVPSQTQLVQRCWPQAQEITLPQVPLGQLYPSLGIDRALALLGAGDRYGWPALVIDGGTALTLTGADASGNLRGGAILPGLQLQLDSLGHGTASLPRLAAVASSLPPRWASTTEDAILSGVLHGTLDSLRAYIRDWSRRFPQSAIVLTGGAAPLLAEHLSDRRSPLPVVAELAFWGLAAVRRGQRGRSPQAPAQP